MRREWIRRAALVGFSMVIGGLSLVIWTLPIQVLWPSQYEIYLVPANGHLISYLLLAWFLIGGYKTALILAWDKNEVYFSSTLYRLKALMFVPMAPVTSFKDAWYKLPSIEYLNRNRT